MSNTKKTVKIKENDLVELIDNILNEALLKNKNGLVKQKKTTNKTAVLEGKLAALEAKSSKLTEGKHK
jgi:hypothetical protein